MGKRHADHQLSKDELHSSSNDEGIPQDTIEGGDSKE